MNGITHRQAKRYMRADLDGLLTDAGRRALKTHLAGCEACRVESESLSALTSRLQNEFRARWDAQDGPSEHVLKNIRSQSRRIKMQKRMDVVFNLLGGTAALVALFFIVTSVISTFQKNSGTAETPIPASEPRSEDRLLAFTSEQEGNTEIYTVRADGSDMRNITNNPVRDANPYWSPDGKSIAFESDRNGYSQIFLMDADGSNVTQLTYDKISHNLPLNIDGNSNPWSPDGKKLLVLQQGKSDSESTLQSIDINNGNATPLIVGRLSLNTISWSPDGKRVGFVLNDLNNTSPDRFIPQLNVVSADGDNLVNINSLLPADESPGGYTAPRIYWSRDGQSIFFTASNLPVEGGFGFGSDSPNPYSWKVYEAILDSRTLLSNVTTRSPIGGWWQGSYFIFPFVGTSPWTWISSDGIVTVNPFRNCQDLSEGGYLYQQSLNGNVAIGVHCPNSDWWLYSVNPRGTMLPLIDSPIATSPGELQNIAWSQDDKFIAINAVFNEVDLYIVNVAGALKDPSVHPVKISLGTSEFIFPPAWQPVP